MEAAITAQVTSHQHTQDPAGQSHPRQSVRGGGRGRGNRRDILSLRPATVGPAPLHSTNDPPEPQHSGASQEPHSTSRGRGRGRGRAREHGRNAVVQRTVNGRLFRGQLTQETIGDTDPALLNSALQADAAVFVPGQDHSHASYEHASRHKQQRQPRQAKPRLPKSEAPDIATRTHDDIDNGHYECPICTADVRRNSKVWSCHTCWTVFHLTCIKKWSSNEGSAASRPDPQGADFPSPRQWRCPGCNLPKDELPSTYTCWCEKETDPRPLSGLPPHSCGQTCGKERVRKCPHPCQLTCHAGPCPPCTHTGPTQSCFCGKHETTKRCSETNYDSGWTCGEVCGVIMPCGEHFCPSLCHDGPCGGCQVRLPARCYCGQVEKGILCCDQAAVRKSQQRHDGSNAEAVVESWSGAFDCGRSCDRLFDCGLHRCRQDCHTQDAAPSHCPRAPDRVTRCSCGKTPLHELTDQARTTCEDPIPACRLACERPLACDHLCPKVCHSGDCPPCAKTVTINCRCGRTTSNTLCHQGHEEQPQCMRICRVNLNCGRHACDERCCSGERKAIERQASKRRQRPLSAAPRSADDGFEAEHICTRQCGRLLKCGNHVCEELCHKGPCGSCREAIFEEISCDCDRTVLQPPLPCGTQPPPCKFPCRRPKACGHPQVGHNCHLNTDNCPKCPFLVNRKCLCGKKMLKNQQCWLADVRCGQICGQKLKCGVHFCRKTCHRHGDCEDPNGQTCKQACGKEKKVCGHPDEAICHAPYACKEDKPCQSKIFITCECQAQKQELKCCASKSSEGNTSKSLPCNDECARLERNRKLAVALNIDQSAHVDGGDHIPFSTETLNLFAQGTKWGQTQEREFRVFAASLNEKRLRFKPMPPQQRSFIHSLAEDFGLDSESVDPEPHRHVLIWKTPRFVAAPNKTLADALRLRQRAQRSITASANASDNEASGVSKPRRKAVEPYNSFVIKNPRFGLTIDEVKAELEAAAQQLAGLSFDIDFLPSDEVLLKVSNQNLTVEDTDRLLHGLRAPLAAGIASKGYGCTQLCHADVSHYITRLESDSIGAGDGWSRVAAKKAAPRISLQSSTAGPTNPFAALSGSGKVTFAKKKAEKTKVVPDLVVDDWEAAEMAAEEEERVADGSDHDEHVRSADKNAEAEAVAQEPAEAKE